MLNDTSALLNHGGSQFVSSAAFFPIIIWTQRSLGMTLEFSNFGRKLDAPRALTVFHG